MHIPFRDNKRLTGTPRYASVNAHFGMEQSRRDDLESIGYMLIYFLTSKLPWQGIQNNIKADKYGLIGTAKKCTNLQFLCHSCPLVFQRYLEYCRSIQFEETPNYKYITNIFREAMASLDFYNDLRFDWFDSERIARNRARRALRVGGAGEADDLGDSVDMVHGVAPSFLRLLEVKLAYYKKRAIQFENELEEFAFLSYLFSFKY